jgi:hypothetical protein
MELHVFDISVGCTILERDDDVPYGRSLMYRIEWPSKTRVGC